ncbi:hypothetical protein [Streptomyces atroolivaceus]|uniref:hypothetical protein n=1 Tax=Streptomyces atroolivaceus TaxID=66869 RepID=UPI00362D4C95
MVSSPHEAMHRVFQEYPELFSRVSEVLGVSFPPFVSADVVTTDLTESRPVERRVDTLLRIETEHDGPFLLAVEAQGKKDPDKPTSWAYYVSYLLEKYRVPTTLLVVCQDRATAAWAARPVPLGSPQWPVLTLRPLVAGPHNIPAVTDVAEARKDLALATLSAALRDAPDDIAAPIVELTAQGLGNRPAAQQWRNLVAVDLSFYISPLSEEIRDEGRAEGEARGRAEDILLVFDERGIDVPDGIRNTITGCRDLDVLRRWLRRAATAATADEILDGERPA